MRRKVMRQRALKVVFAFRRQFRQRYSIGCTTFHHCEQLALVVNHRRVASIFTGRHFTTSNVFTEHIKAGVNPLTFLSLFSQPWRIDKSIPVGCLPIFEMDTMNHPITIKDVILRLIWHVIGVRSNS